MFFLLLLIGEVAVQLSCGLDPSQHVVAGSEAKPGEWPWQLSLEHQTSASWVHGCGAVLIDRRFAITAAHCLAHAQRKYRLVLGRHKRSPAEGTEQYIELNTESDVKIHENFTNAQPWPNDIALLTLTTSADLSNPRISPGRLPDKLDRDYHDNPNCWLAGWGSPARGSPLRNTLQNARLDVMENLFCSVQMDRDVEPHQLCAQDDLSYERGPCYGDDGSGLSCLRDGRYDVSGLVSWFSATCEQLHPAVFTRVSHFLAWIEKNIAEKKKQLSNI